MNDVKRIESPSAIIVGGGIAGLTLADRLSLAGIRIKIIEREEKVGGLARSMKYGDFSFDIGPHRFHTYSKAVEQYLHDVLGQAYRTIGRSSGVYFFGRLHHWPLQLSSIFRLPPLVLMRCAFDLFTKPEFDGESFSSYILSRYGKTLYKAFFRDYTMKFCHVEPEMIHESWARASIHRAIIDKRYDQSSLLDVARVTLLPKRAKTRFLYPYGGMDSFHTALVRRITGSGGEIITGTSCKLSGMPGETPSVVIHGRTLTADRIFWSGSITQAYENLFTNARPINLRYLGLALFNIEARNVHDGMNQWTYFSSPDFILSRVSFPHNFDPSLVPPGHQGITAEVTVPENQQSIPWEDWESRVLEELENAGVVKRDDVRDVHRQFIPEAYPIYELHYPKVLDSVMKEFEDFPGLVLFGRTGRFWYNNMDDSIEASLDLADKEIAGWRKRNLL